MSFHVAVSLTVANRMRDCRRVLLILFSLSLPVLSPESEACQEADSTQQSATEPTSPIKKTPASDSGSKDAVKADAASDKVIDLLSADLVMNWELFSTKEGTSISEVWRIVDVENERQLACTGTPKGFLVTKAKYQNFELKFQWKYLKDPNGNSGVLIFTKNEPRLWPTSMQVQLHQPTTGSIFPSGDAASDNTSEAKDLASEVGKWNKCRVLAEDGRISVEINGKPAGEVSGCKPSMGRIALQSEGSETRFRKMQLRILNKTNTVDPGVPAADIDLPKTSAAEDAQAPSTAEEF